MRMRPNQKFGVEKPKSAKKVLARSTPELRFTADTMPSGTAMASEITMEKARSRRVTGRRSTMA